LGTGGGVRGARERIRQRLEELRPLVVEMHDGAGGNHVTALFLVALAQIRQDVVIYELNLSKIMQNVSKHFQQDYKTLSGLAYIKKKNSKHT
jgi:hypothetical protein